MKASKYIATLNDNALDITVDDAGSYTDREALHHAVSSISQSIQEDGINCTIDLRSPEGVVRVTGESASLGTLAKSLGLNTSRNDR